ncbi:related to acyl-CoA synthetase [Rhynchosporium graminicola]|uniref:Related to acyl-CoA synthetase n=1 Tax=Rhynchosporium graminicola TaxID=2792576 RepID=A0A1E1LPC2_9HELO|nr:related to acyl-CoA synthetase [Rhynchosporium commune]
MDLVSWTFANPPLDEDKPLYIDPSNLTRSLSFAQNHTLVRKLIAGFNAHAFGTDGCVCVVSLNDINYTPIYLSIIGSGLRFTGANPGYTARELAHHLRITGAQHILTSLKSLSVSLRAAEECSIPISRIFILNFESEDIPPARQSWEKLLCHGEMDWTQDSSEDIEAAYVSTSGTSGLPKAAVISHGYLVSQGKIVEDLVRAQVKAQNGGGGRVDNDMRSLIALPPFHVFTIPLQHAVPLRTGCPAYIMPRFEENLFVNTIKKVGITHTIVVPPIMMTLAKHDKGELDSLKRVFVGGSCASDGMQSKLYGVLSEEARIVQVYGMTETGWATCWSKGDKDGSGSVGQAVDGSRLRAVDASGTIVQKDGSTGEIQIQTAHAMKGYLSNTFATIEARTADGWIRTGDIGYAQNGNWYVIDRTKDLIKVRGWQVSPAEIEAALLEYPGIQDAGVIASPAADGCGEVPLAFVVKNPDAKIDEISVKDFLGTRLARYKNVAEVVFIDLIPRNPTGKILRRVLRDVRAEKSKTKDQVAAIEYKSALRDLVAYQRSIMSACEETTTVKGKTEEIVTELLVEDPVSKKRKRNCCPATKFKDWRKLRCISRTRGTVVIGSNP